MPNNYISHYVVAKKMDIHAENYSSYNMVARKMERHPEQNLHQLLNSYVRKMERHAEKTVSVLNIWSAARQIKNHALLR